MHCKDIKREMRLLAEEQLNKDKHKRELQEGRKLSKSPVIPWKGAGVNVGAVHRHSLKSSLDIHQFKTHKSQIFMQALQLLEKVS